MENNLALSSAPVAQTHQIFLCSQIVYLLFAALINDGLEASVSVENTWVGFCASQVQL